VRVLCPIVEIPVLTEFYPREDLSLGGPVARQFIGDDHAWYGGQPLGQFAEELLRSLLVAPTLHQDVEHVALLIHRPPEIMPLVLNCQKHLIQMPFVSGPRATPPELIGILLAKFAAPFRIAS